MSDPATSPAAPTGGARPVAYMVDCGSANIAEGDVRFWRAKRKDEAHGCALAHGTQAVPLYTAVDAIEVGREFAPAAPAPVGNAYRGMPIATDDPGYHCPRCGLDDTGIRQAQAWIGQETAPAPVGGLPGVEDLAKALRETDAGSEITTYRGRARAILARLAERRPAAAGSDCLDAVVAEVEAACASGEEPTRTIADLRRDMGQPYPEMSRAELAAVLDAARAAGRVDAGAVRAFLAALDDKEAYRRVDDGPRAVVEDARRRFEAVLKRRSALNAALAEAGPDGEGWRPIDDKPASDTEGDVWNDHGDGLAGRITDCLFDGERWIYQPYPFGDWEPVTNPLAWMRKPAPPTSTQPATVNP